MLRCAFAFLSLGLWLVATSPITAQPTNRDPTRAPAGNYVLEPGSSSLLIRIPLMGGLSRYAMRFNTLSGDFTYDPGNWRNTEVEITVDPRSIVARNSAFSRAVLGYFEPDKYPVILFRSTSLATDAEGIGLLTGDLTFHGVTRPVALAVEFKGVGADPAGSGARMAFSGTGRIRRSEFGVTAARVFADDQIDLVFDVEFVRK
ncbi:YceI family protein [Phenylobacterium sp.]|jgi:polyisoprenoid-binding protein YceI|uniref:YceI family protein n=1 Tax=Phenylobacterium sp. TaxID=1871053 RepID=UPI0037C744D9